MKTRGMGLSELECQLARWEAKLIEARKTLQQIKGAIKRRRQGKVTELTRLMIKNLPVTSNLSISLTIFEGDGITLIEE